jgi:hypothetical protein
MEPSDYAQPAAWLNKAFEGYVVNTQFSAENSSLLSNLIGQLEHEFGQAVFGMPSESLHITLLDWIAPLVDYEGQHKRRLFEKIYPEYHQALTEILRKQAPIQVVFDQIKVSASTIFIVGKDNGQFQAIRDQFIKLVDLQPGTKQPPQIIHSSIARFTKPIQLKAVRAFVSQQTLAITQDVVDFRLVHTSREPMLEYEVLKTYQLN